MGKAFQGVYGSFMGKVGNVVGRVRQGVQIYAIYQPNVANPRTADQMLVRAKFALLSRFCSRLLSVINVGFASLDGYRYGTPYSSALGFNFKESPFSGSTASSVALDYSKLYISEGQLDNPLNCTGSLDANDFTASWSDNSGLGNASAADEIYCVVYNPTTSTFVQGKSLRQERSVTIALPSSWSGDAVEAYVFSVSAEKAGLTSNSIHIGQFQV